MDTQTSTPGALTKVAGNPGGRSRWWWLAGLLIVLLAGLAVAARLMIARAEPILRKRVVETLATRFKSRVELSELHVWIANGIHAEGKGLKIYGATDPNPWEPGVQPLLEVSEFQFQTALRNLFRTPMHVDTIFAKGFTMNIPPKKDRKEITNIRRRGGKMSILVDNFVFADATIIINTAKPDKPPLEFDISDLRMTTTGRGQPLRFDATLINPRPIGHIHSTGLFGPLDERSPRDSAVIGDYVFTDADLASIRGLGGILTSEGHYTGRLGRIEVTGETDTPNFKIAISGHPVPLHTDFHAIVDGTDGDTYLDPVRARIQHSSLIARGRVVRTKTGHGRDIELNVVLDKAKIEDLLTVAVRTSPPVMSGKVEMNFRMSLPPGDADLANRLRLVGTFLIPDASFDNAKVQKRINDFSLRSQGELKLIGNTPELAVTSELRGAFKLDNGILSFSSLRFQIPGTNADMTGNYSLDGKIFDFHGLLKMQAKLSQMTSGWKSVLLKPVDPFFHKHGAGTEIPFKITGAHAEPHFGLDFHHKEAESPQTHRQLTSRQ